MSDFSSTPPEPRRPPPWLRPELITSWTEFACVAALLLAWPIRNSTTAALHGSSSHFMQMLLSDDRLLWATFGESLLLAFFLVYLKGRGWKPGDLRIGIGWGTSLQGLGLLLLTEGAVIGTVLGLVGLAYALQTTHRTFLSFLLTISPQLAHHSIQLNWGVMIVAMIVNAFLEEIICMGYIFNQLAARRGPVLALIVTVFLRLACHTYQDPIHLAGIAVLFSLYAVWYCYAGRLWPLIFAHILLDVGSMSVLKVLFG